MPDSKISRLRTYWKNLVRFDNEQAIGAKRLNAFAKWLLDLLRNAIIVGGLSYLATKTGNRTVWLVNGIAWLALFTYCITYSNFIKIHPFNFMSNRRWSARLDSGAHWIFYLAITLVVMNVINKAVAELANAQIAR